MSDYPPLDRWNYVTLLLGQAFVGVISPNMRAIALSFEAGQWMIRCVLQENIEEDIEEFAEALSDFEAMDSSVAPYRFEYLISQDAIQVPPRPGRFIYRRRE